MAPRLRKNLLGAVRALRAADPEICVHKMLTRLRADHPTWKCDAAAIRAAVERDAGTAHTAAELTLTALQPELQQRILSLLPTEGVGRALITCRALRAQAPAVWRAAYRERWSGAVEPHATVGKQAYFFRHAAEKVSRDEAFARKAFAIESERLNAAAHDDTEAGGEDGETTFQFGTKDGCVERREALKRVRAGLAEHASTPAAARALLDTLERGFDVLDYRHLSMTNRYGAEKLGSIYSVAVSSAAGDLTTLHLEWGYEWADSPSSSSWTISAHLIGVADASSIAASPWRDGEDFDQVDSYEVGVMLELAAQGRLTRELQLDLRQAFQSRYRLEYETVMGKTIGMSALLHNFHDALEERDELSPLPPRGALALRLLDNRHGVQSGPQRFGAPPSAADLKKLYGALGLEPAVVRPDDVLLTLLLLYGVIEPGEWAAPPEADEGDGGAHALWEFEGQHDAYFDGGGDRQAPAAERLTWNAAWA